MYLRYWVFTVGAAKYLPDVKRWNDCGVLLLEQVFLKNKHLQTSCFGVSIGYKRILLCGTELFVDFRTWGLYTYADYSWYLFDNLGHLLQLFPIRDPRVCP